jgi:hypothetical protein
MGGLPTAAVIAICAVLLVQLVLQIAGLVDLARRRHVTGGRKWVWVLVIVLGNLLGAIVYFAVGRSAAAPGPAAERAGDRGARDRAIDRLYGDDEGR